MTKTIIYKPIITEKSLKDASLGVFTFIVDKSADKLKIKKTIEDMFGVHVENVSSIIVKGKTKRVGKKRAEIKRPDFKKVMVKLKPGEKIGLFEVGTTK